MTKHYTPAEVEKLIAEATEGPWLVYRDDTYFCISSAGSDLACFDYFDGSDADAKLIGAAPAVARQFIEQAREIERLGALQDLAFTRGVEVGWNCETAEERENLTKPVRDRALKELARLRSLLEGE